MTRPHGESNGEASFRVFVEQLYQGLPYENMVFPDAFEIPPQSWCFNSSGRCLDATTSSLCLRPFSAHPHNFAIPRGDIGRFSLPPLSLHLPRIVNVGTKSFSSAAACDRMMMQRGLHEERRLQLRRRIHHRKTLQTMSGQASIEGGKRQLCMSSVTAKAATAEQRRREEMRDIPHALWVSQHRSENAWYSEHRRRCLQSLRSRRQERAELEHYTGSLHDKLLLSQMKSLQKKYNEKQEDEINDTATATAMVAAIQ